MLENIRSKYIFKYPLSFIIEKKKLNLVRYSKLHSNSTLNLFLIPTNISKTLLYF